LISAGTLLMPGYVDVEEVENIAEVIDDIDARISHSLLGFYQHYLMSDLPTTDSRTAILCAEGARRQGLEQVTLGNVNPLS